MRQHAQHSAGGGLAAQAQQQRQLKQQVCEVLRLFISEAV
jgi:hypothetical protein